MDAEFRVYDAMLAICKSAAQKLKREGKWKDGDPLPDCYARIGSLCNMVDRNRSTVIDQIKRLEASGWIISRNPTNSAGKKVRRRDALGRESSDLWKVIEHDEYTAQHGCPPLRFDESGLPLKAGRMPPAIERENVRRILGSAGLEATLPDEFADGIADAIAARRASTGKPVQADLSNTGKPVQAKTGNPVQALTGNPVQDQHWKTSTELEGFKPVTQHQPPPPESVAPESGAPLKNTEAEEEAAKTRIENWMHDNFSLMGAISKKERTELEKLIRANGAVLVLQALQLFANRPSFGGVNNPWMLFLSRADATIAQIKHVEKSKPDQALIDASIRRQAAENWKHLTTPGKPIAKDGTEIVECDILGLLPE
jgi:hypothetical protein